MTVTDAKDFSLANAKDPAIRNFAVVAQRNNGSRPDVAFWQCAQTFSDSSGLLTDVNISDTMEMKIE
jgi:hypothetical protein